MTNCVLLNTTRGRITPIEMSTEGKDVGVSQTEKNDSSEVINVQNVALADATAKSNVSPWTKSMFRVSGVSSSFLFEIRS